MKKLRLRVVHLGAGPAGLVALFLIWSVTSACDCDESVPWPASMFCSDVTQDVKYLVAFEVGREEDTDANVGGAQFGLNNVISGVGLDAGITYGRGDQSFYSEGLDANPFAKAFGISGIQSEHTKYSVWQFGVRGRYPFKVSENSAVRVYPFVGPKLYRWDLRNCSGCDAETSFMVDIGAGAMWRFVGLDVYTTLDGPDVGVRLKLLAGFGKR